MTPAPAGVVPCPGRYRSTVPSTSVTLRPPTRIVPSESWVISNRAARPIAAPCVATYGVPQQSLVDEPPGDRGVEAAGRGVLHHGSVLGPRGPHLERDRRARR